MKVEIVDIYPMQLYKELWCSSVAILKFLIIIEQEALHFNFALDPENYVFLKKYKISKEAFVKYTSLHFIRCE